MNNYKIPTGARLASSEGRVCGYQFGKQLSYNPYDPVERLMEWRYWNLGFDLGVRARLLDVRVGDTNDDPYGHGFVNAIPLCHGEKNPYPANSPDYKLCEKGAREGALWEEVEVALNRFTSALKFTSD